MKIPLLVFMSEIKKRSFTEKVKFPISFLLKNSSNLVYSNASAFRTETQHFPKPFCVQFDAFSVFTGYVFGCKHGLQQLKYSSKLRLKNRSQEIYTDRMPKGDSGDLTSRAFTMLTWRV